MDGLTFLEVITELPIPVDQVSVTVPKKPTTTLSESRLIQSCNSKIMVFLENGSDLGNVGTDERPHAEVLPIAQTQR